MIRLAIDTADNFCGSQGGEEKEGQAYREDSTVLTILLSVLFRFENIINHKQAKFLCLETFQKKNKKRLIKKKAPRSPLLTLLAVQVFRYFDRIDSRPRRCILLSSPFVIRFILIPYKSRIRYICKQRYRTMYLKS